MVKTPPTKTRPGHVNRGQFRRGHDPRRHKFTAADRSKGGQQSRANLVPFAKGYDPRRHDLTREECSIGGQRGFATIEQIKPWVLLWLKKKMRDQGYRPSKRREAAHV